MRWENSLSTSKPSFYVCCKKALSSRSEAIARSKSIHVFLPPPTVDLDRAIQKKQFREDLYYRLSVFPLRLPPLRERLEDLSLICEVVLRDLGRRVGRQGYRLTRDGLATLSCYHWPGNIRELANVLERAMILSTDRRLGPAVLDLPTPVSLARAEDRAVASITVSSGTVQTLEAVEREYIRRVLALVGGSDLRSRWCGDTPWPQAVNATKSHEKTGNRATAGAREVAIHEICARNSKVETTPVFPTGLRMRDNPVGKQSDG